MKHIEMKEQVWFYYYRHYKMEALKSEMVVQGHTSDK